MMAENKEFEIFFHVGLGKTASTYLQYKVFPKFTGVHYIQRTQYKNVDKIIANSNSNKYFVSNEFDRQYFKELKKISTTYPEAKIIIILRRHASWMASQYRRKVKNGYPFSFTQYFDVENDKGLWNRDEADYFKKIEFAEERLFSKPLVLFYEDMRKDPLDFFRRIAEFIGAYFDSTQISLAAKHKSYSEKQLKVVRKIYKKIYKGEKEGIKNIFFKRMHHYFIVAPVRYSLLFFAKFVPDSKVSEESLILQQDMKKVDDYFENDWKKCIEYAKKNNPV